MHEWRLLTYLGWPVLIALERYPPSRRETRNIHNLCYYNYFYEAWQTSRAVYHSTVEDKYFGAIFPVTCCWTSDEFSLRLSSILFGALVTNRLQINERLTTKLKRKLGAETNIAYLPEQTFLDRLDPRTCSTRFHDSLDTSPLGSYGDLAKFYWVPRF